MFHLSFNFFFNWYLYHINFGKYMSKKKHYLVDHCIVHLCTQLQINFYKIANTLDRAKLRAFLTMFLEKSKMNE